MQDQPLLPTSQTSDGSNGSSVKNGLLIGLCVFLFLLTSPVMSARLLHPKVNTKQNAEVSVVETTVVEPGATIEAPTSTSTIDTVAPQPTTTTAPPVAPNNVDKTPDTASLSGALTMGRDSASAYPLQAFKPANCACSVSLPFTPTQRASALSDGTPANLVLSERDGDPLSAAVWTLNTNERANVDRLDETLTALAQRRGTIASKRTVGTAVDPQVEATVVNGQSVALINLRTTDSHLYVILVATSDGQFVGEIYGRVLQSFKAL